MNWTKLIYVLIIVLIYVPMVFLGANVFFPKYTGSNSYYQQTQPDCYMNNPYPANFDKLNATEQAVYTEKQQQCNKEMQDQQKKFEEDKNSYDGIKYIFIALFNLFILLFALFIPLQDSVTMGLFLGSIAATFGGTIAYFQTRTKIGFIILVIIFFAMIFFINKKKDTFIDWNTKNK